MKVRNRYDTIIVTTDQNAVAMSAVLWGLVR